MMHFDKSFQKLCKELRENKYLSTDNLWKGLKVVFYIHCCSFQLETAVN